MVLCRETNMRCAPRLAEKSCDLSVTRGEIRSLPPAAPILSGAVYELLGTGSVGNVGIQPDNPNINGICLLRSSPMCTPAHPGRESGLSWLSDARDINRRSRTHNRDGVFADSPKYIKLCQIRVQGQGQWSKIQETSHGRPK